MNGSTSNINSVNKATITTEAKTTNTEKINTTDTTTADVGTTDTQSTTTTDTTDAGASVTDTTTETTTDTTTDTTTETTTDMGTTSTDTSTTTTDTSKIDSATEVSVVNAEEIDLGDYLESMAIGEKQLISATVIPTDTTDQTLAYSSSNEEVATINGLGRITAVSVGTTKITVKCGKVKNSFKLQVKKSNDVEVTDIEIGNYEEEMEVDKSQAISATVIPSDATDTTVKYSSSDSEVATVLSTGEVKAKAKGTVVITVKAGDISKEIEITVKVATTKIEVNKSYVVLKPEEEFQLKANALPSDALQTMTYEAEDKEIATVESNGTIHAKSIGTTSILASNGDMSTAITVIVNEIGSSEQTTEENVSIEATSNRVQNISENDAELISKIENNFDDIEVNVKECNVVNKSILKALYETGKTIHILGEGYTLTIKGSDIVNYENELNTNINVEKENNKLTFVINEGKNLPGLITLQLSEGGYKYLYLFNEAKNKYQQLKVKDFSNFDIDTSGKYTLSVDKLNVIPISIIAIIIASVIALGLVITYIVVKKQYWFW
ncbi:Ig-like protein group 2 [Lachnotalea glycerini]|nr:Ig-like protein group 2 [Lachnotalea glycerini]